MTADRGSVAITLADVELAVRLNALLEADGYATVLVSPFDDIRTEIARAKADVVVFTGAHSGERSNKQARGAHRRLPSASLYYELRVNSCGIAKTSTPRSSIKSPRSGKNRFRR